MESIATARTRSSPRCCCTSATSVAVEPSGRCDLDLDGVEDLGQAVGEDRVDHDALDLDDLADVCSTRSRSPAQTLFSPGEIGGIEGSDAFGRRLARSLAKRDRRLPANRPPDGRLASCASTRSAWSRRQTSRRDEVGRDHPSPSRSRRRRAAGSAGRRHGRAADRREVVDEPLLVRHPRRRPSARRRTRSAREPVPVFGSSSTSSTIRPGEISLTPKPDRLRTLAREEQHRDVAGQPLLVACSRSPASGHGCATVQALARSLRATAPSMKSAPPCAPRPERRRRSGLVSAGSSPDDRLAVVDDGRRAPTSRRRCRSRRCARRPHRR